MFSDPESLNLTRSNLHNHVQARFWRILHFCFHRFRTQLRASPFVVSNQIFYVGRNVGQVLAVKGGATGFKASDHEISYTQLTLCNFDTPISRHKTGFSSADGAVLHYSVAGMLKKRISRNILHNYQAKSNV